MKMNLLTYEVRNILGNFFIPLFGIAMPIFMGAIIPKGILGDVPEAYQEQVLYAIILSMSVMIPMCVGLIGYAASYSLEIEKDIPLRMKLFGYSNQTYILYKILGQILVVTVTFLVYFLVMSLIHGIQIKSLPGTLVYFAFQYLFTLAFLMISHALADLNGKFGQTYAMVMILFFFFLFISGSMGMSYQDFPPFMKAIADQFPLTHFSNAAFDIWTFKLKNYGPLIQTTLVLLFAASLFLLWSIYRQKNRKQ